MNERGRASYLSPQQHWALNQACRPIVEAYGQHVYQVGSSLVHELYRDVDVRCMLPDDEFDALFPNDPPDRLNWTFYPSRLALLNTVISEHLSRVTGLLVDFQFQQATFANATNPGAKARHPLGLTLSEAQSEAIYNRHGKRIAST